ncbi:hypothetical protein B0H10DRAFT_947688 [Mycena sp. CBHHK59/15]|nr:hypothetical protein B0H10DRAFT_947688 [Mycena sp. CBHHK59/15]
MLRFPCHLSTARAAHRRTLHLGHLPSSHSPIVSTLAFFNSVTPADQQIPTFRVLDGVGKPIDGAQLPEVAALPFNPSFLTCAGQIDEAFARRLYENMQLLPTLDTVLYNVQRQGKISFHVGSLLFPKLAVLMSTK